MSEHQPSPSNQEQPHQAGPDAPPHGGTPSPAPPAQGPASVPSNVIGPGVGGGPHVIMANTEGDIRAPQPHGLQEGLNVLQHAQAANPGSGAPGQGQNVIMATGVHAPQAPAGANAGGLGAGGPVHVAGDFNADGVVDAADFRAGPGSAAPGQGQNVIMANTEGDIRAPQVGAGTHLSAGNTSQGPASHFAGQTGADAHGSTLIGAGSGAGHGVAHGTADAGDGAFHAADAHGAAHDAGAHVAGGHDGGADFGHHGGDVPDAGAHHI